VARSRAADARFDWRGGVNTTFTEDVLDPTELRKAKNGRLAIYGGITKRLGSKRIHTAALGAPSLIAGLHGMFDSATGRRIVAIANGHLYHKLASAGDAVDFTDLNAGLGAPTRIRMVQYRRGAQMFLYIATGTGNLFEFDGAALPANIATAPVNCLDVLVYKSRLFVTNGTKQLAWSKLLQGNDFSLASGGGTAEVETFDSEPLIGLGKVGGSILLFKEDTTARYTGVNPADVRIDTDTEGVSAHKGAISRMSICQLPEAVAFLSAEGPEIATVSGVESLGLKIEREIDQLDKSAWDNAGMVYHKGRRALWLTLPGAAAGQNDRLWEMSERAGRSWSGPWPIARSVLARFERQDGTETVISGGYDGRVRREDEGPTAKDDVLQDGTGGSNIELEVDLPELLFGDPSREKSLAGKKQSVQADLAAAGSLVVAWSSERGSGSTTIPTAGAGAKSYPYLTEARGKRIRVTYRESTAEVVTLNGGLLEASVGRSRK
jgi:hypothetical protein